MEPPTLSVAQWADSSPRDGDCAAFVRERCPACMNFKSREHTGLVYVDVGSAEAFEAVRPHFPHLGVVPSTIVWYGGAWCPAILCGDRSADGVQAFRRAAPLLARSVETSESVSDVPRLALDEGAEGERGEALRFLHDVADDGGAIPTARIGAAVRTLFGARAERRGRVLLILVRPSCGYSQMAIAAVRGAPNFAVEETAWADEPDLAALVASRRPETGVAVLLQSIERERKEDVFERVLAHVEGRHTTFPLVLESVEGRLALVGGCDDLMERYFGET